MATETSKIREVLSRVASELEDEEVREDFEALKAKKPTLAELLEAIREAPPEERAQLREILREEGLPTEPPADDDGKGKPPKDKPKPPPQDEPPPTDEPPSTRRTRPGRKSGMAYDWDLDETGRPVRLQVAKVYSGEDEPDEVEMLPDEEQPPPPEDDE